MYASTTNMGLLTIRLGGEPLHFLWSMLRSAPRTMFVAKKSSEDDNLENMAVGLLDIPPEVWLSHYPYCVDDVSQASLARLCSVSRQAYMVFVPVLYSSIWLGSRFMSQDAWIGRLRAFKLIRTLNEREELGQYVRELVLSFATSEFEFEQAYDASDPTVKPKVLGAFDLVNHAVPPDFHVPWRWIEGAKGNIANQAHRLSIVIHLLLRRLPNLLHLKIHGNLNLNIAIVAIHCSALRSLWIDNRHLRPYEMTVLLRNDKLEKLRAELCAGASTQSIDTLPARLDQLQELELGCNAAHHDERSTVMRMISSLLRKLPNLVTLGLTVKGTDDGLSGVIRAVSKHLKILNIHVNYDPDAAYSLDWRALQRLKELEEFQVHPDTMLGIETCKHQERDCSANRRPEHLVSEMLPNSLKELWLHVDSYHIMRNGDDYWVRIMRALVDNPSRLPSLKLLGLVIAPPADSCSICRCWYGTTNANGESEMHAYITRHEYDRLCRLAKIRGIEVTCPVDYFLAEIPVDSRAKGLNLRRIEKINARRSWYDADRDEDMGLFELFNT